MSTGGEYTKVELRPPQHHHQHHHGPPVASWSLEEEVCPEDEESDDESETERKVERTTRRKRNTDLILAVLDANYEEVARLLSIGVSPMVRCQQSMATAAHIAALRGEERILGLLAERSQATAPERSTPALTARDSAGRQPHHLAAAAGHTDILRLVFRLEPGLINSQAELVDLKTQVKDEQLDSFLHDHLEVTNLLKSVTLGSTALHIAAKYSFIDMVEFLLDKNAEVNVKDKDGLSPLDVAGMYADPTVPGTIVSGAEPAIYSPMSESGGDFLGPNTSTDEVATSPFALFSSGGGGGWKSSSTSGGLFPTPETPGFRLGPPPLRHRSRQGGSNALLANTTVTVVSSLIKGGGRLSQDPAIAPRTTPLHRFVEKNDVEAIKDLLDSSSGSGEGDGIRTGDVRRLIEARDALGRTPVHLAVELNLKEPLELLLERDSAPVNMTDSEGRTPLHRAVQFEWTNLIELLLEHRTDLRLQTSQGENVLHIAARRRNQEILTTLLERASKSVVNQRDNDGYTPLFRAVESGDVRCVELLLDTGRPRKYIPKNNNSLIHIAVKSKSLNVLKVLSKRLSFDWSHYNRQNKDGFGPIHLAVEEDSVLCLEYLLDTDKICLKIEKAGENGGTALHIAAEKGRLKAMEKILERIEQEGSEELITMENRSGRQPLILAALGGHTDCAMLLLKHGANLAARDSQVEQTALDLIYYNLPSANCLLDDLMDYFMKITSKEHREDSPDFQVTLDYRCLLADKKNDHRQLGVIEAIIKCRHEGLRRTLFLHPLTESFLRFKWKQLELFFRILVLVFISHLLSLTGYGLCTYVYEACAVCSYSWILRCIVWGTVLPIFILEMMTVRWDKSYLLDSETWTKWFVMVSSTLAVVPLASDWTRFNCALSVLFAWVQLLFLVARDHAWGLRVLMFLEVAANVLQVFSTFLFLLLGFAFSFLILFEKEHPFESLGTTLAKVIVMMVELDYGNVYGKDSEADQSTTLGVMGRLLFLGFVVLVVMVLNNLVIGMSVSDVAELEAQGRSKRVGKQASFLVLFEKILYQDMFPATAHDFIRRHRAAPSSTQVFPNRKKDRESNPLPGELRSRVLRVVMNREELDEAETLSQRVESLSQDVRELSKLVKEIKESLKKR